MATTYIGQLAEADLAELKKKHKVSGIITKDKAGEKHICYVKEPTREIIIYAYSDGGKNPLRVNELAFNSCWLAGSAEIKTDRDMFLSASSKIAEFLDIQEAEIVNF